MQSDGPLPLPECSSTGHGCKRLVSIQSCKSANMRHSTTSKSSHHAIHHRRRARGMFLGYEWSMELYLISVQHCWNKSIKLDYRHN